MEVLAYFSNELSKYRMVFESPVGHLVNQVEGNGAVHVEAQEQHKDML